MIENRPDLSAWVMHFVHDRNPENDPAYELNQGEIAPLFPFHENDDGHRFEVWEAVDVASTLEPDASAFAVLMKIIEDGHIRSGWSFRNGKPTIYGPRAACCFTEMPLYALVDYAKRRKSDAVGAYAIGLLRSELFEAGARPALYGLSGPHRELTHGRPTRWEGWPRKLDPSCGIAENEQYRYVAMNLSKDRRIDWGHEREWRWADVSDCYPCPGLPVWLDESPCRFSRVMIVVPTVAEAERILNKLKELHDAGVNNFDYPYDREALAATRVVALESLTKDLTSEELLTIRLDDLPGSSIQAFSSPPVDEAFKDSVKAALAEAHEAAEAEVTRMLAKGKVRDLCGFAHLTLYTPQSPLATALLELGEATVIGGVGYWISDFQKHARGHQALCLAEGAVEAARIVMEKHFPHDRFGCETRLD